MEFIETTEEEQKEYQDLLERLFESVNYIVKREASNDDEEINDAVERGLAYVFEDKNVQAIYDRVGRILVEHRTMAKMLISIKTGDLDVDDCFQPFEDSSKAWDLHDGDLPDDVADVEEVVKEVIDLEEEVDEVDRIGEKEGLSLEIIKRAQLMVDKKSKHLMEEHTNAMFKYLHKCLSSLESASEIKRQVLISNLFARLRAAIYLIAELTKKSHLH